MMAHLIFVCKYRKKLLLIYGDFIKEQFYSIAETSDFTIEEMEVDLNHIHILIKYKPKVSILQIVRRLKQISTINIWKSHKIQLSKHFWNEIRFGQTDTSLVVLDKFLRRLLKSINKIKGRLTSTELKTQWFYTQTYKRSSVVI